MSNCVTHHQACDCRERKFTQLCADLKESDDIMEALCAENEKLLARIAVLRDALQFVACDGMDDADFYTQEHLVEGVISMTIRAREALAQDAQEAMR